MGPVLPRSESYSFACTDEGAQVTSAPEKITSKTLEFGDRIINREDLDEFDIKCGYGRLGRVLGHGSFSCVRDFYFDRQQGLRAPTPDKAEWVFKPEFPHEQQSYEKKLRSSAQYPLTPQGWLHSTLRSICSYKVAQVLGVDNIAETHLGFAGGCPGALMRKVEGRTVHDWLIQEGFYEREGIQQGFTKEQLFTLQHDNSDRVKKLFRQIMNKAFEKAINECNLDQDWSKIKSVDFITGQSDRWKLSNMMVTEQDGRLRLIGIDNDLSFPVNNEHLFLGPPLKAYVIMPSKNPGLCDRMVERLHPEALQAFRKRVDVAEQHWFQKDEEGQVNMKLGPEADIPKGNYGSETRSEGRACTPYHQGGAPTYTMEVYEWESVSPPSPSPSPSPLPPQTRKSCNIL